MKSKPQKAQTSDAKDGKKVPVPDSTRPAEKKPGVKAAAAGTAEGSFRIVRVWF